MSELEAQLQGILSSPEQMQKIMEMARQFSGSLPGSESRPPCGDGPDPQMMGRITHLAGTYGAVMGEVRKKAAVLTSLRPCLRPDRQAAVDKAIQAAAVTRLARSAITEFSGGKHE